MPSLEGKVALVTGAGSPAGFGSAIAHKLASLGAHVIITDIDAEGGQSIASSYTSSSSSSVGSITFLLADVTSSSSWDSVIKQIVSKHGSVDILINNAGTTYKNKPTVEVTEEEFDKVFAVNVKSIFHSVKAFVPQAMEGKKGAVIVNIASIGALRPRGGLVWYNASKGAVANATKGLAAEYGPHNIRVNAILPLLCGTQLFSSFVGVEDTPENREKFVAQVPLGRLSETSDVANACAWLASDEASFITGVCMEVDGGKGIC